MCTHLYSCISLWAAGYCSVFQHPNKCSSLNRCVNCPCDCSGTAGNPWSWPAWDLAGWGTNAEMPSKGVASGAAQMESNCFKTLKCQPVPFHTLNRPRLCAGNCPSTFSGNKNMQSVLSWKESTHCEGESCHAKGSWLSSVYNISAVLPLSWFPALSSAPQEQKQASSVWQQWVFFSDFLLS